MKEVPSHYMTAEGIAKVNEQGKLLMARLRAARDQRRRIVETFNEVIKEPKR